MADELDRVRPKFAKNASKPLISQLLDDLVRDHVLNDEEREEILEENNLRADKARRLLDSVKKKGDGASMKMIADIKRIDPGLYSELGLDSSELASGQPAPPDVVPKQEEGWSAPLIHTTEDFWTTKQMDKHVYPGTRMSIKNRVALLITNIEFADKTQNRKGAEKDQVNMRNLLRSLNYEVVQYTNLTGQEMDHAVKEFSKHPKLNLTDSVVVVIMSHGVLGAVQGVNHDENEPDEFPIDKIYKHLDSKNCPALIDKPKIIIIQACRGEKGAVRVSDNAVFTDGAGEDVEEDFMRCVHKEKDFISLLSSTPNTVSYRQPVHGCYLIQFVVEVMNTHAHKDDLEELFRKVMQRFEEVDIPNKKQMPNKDRCSLTKRFYFYTGL